MGCRSCEKPKMNYRKGLWSPEEDQRLRDYILKHGLGCWSAVPAKAGELIFRAACTCFSSPSMHIAAWTCSCKENSLLLMLNFRLKSDQHTYYCNTTKMQFKFCLKFNLKHYKFD